MKENKSTIPAKTCYNHIGGKPGELLMQNFIDKGCIAIGKSSDKHYHITTEGEKAFKKSGLDLSQIKAE